MVTFQNRVRVLTVCVSLGAVPAVVNAEMLYWRAVHDEGLPEERSTFIKRSDLNGANIEQLVTLTSTVTNSFGLALDREGGKMYWAEREAGKIRRANLDGACAEDVVTELLYPLNIALNLAGGKIYWLQESDPPDPGDPGVYRANLDGTGVELIVDMPFRDIALDLGGGKMYLTGPGGGEPIWRANLDGSGLEILIDWVTFVAVFGTTFCTEIELDVVGGKMYFASFGTVEPSKIGRADLDGSNPEVLLSDDPPPDPDPVVSIPTGFALDLGRGQMYWSNISQVISRANLDGSGVEIVLEETVFNAPMTLTLDLGLAPRPPIEPCFPHERRKNRYISFDASPGDVGISIAFKVELKSINMGSCDDGTGAQGGNVDFCRVDRGAADCKACSGSGDSCISASIDCPPGESCDPTGAVCVNDLPNSGGPNVGMIWWVGPEKDTATEPSQNIHLLVSEPFRKVSTDWPNPVHAGDCEVVPQASYGVRAVETATGLESDELVVETTQFPSVSPPAPFWWGDVVGVLAFHCNGDIREATCTSSGDCGGDPCERAWELPNGVTNVDDVTAALWTSAPAPPTTVSADFNWVDVHGNDSFTPGSQNFDPPNNKINASDLQQIGSAFGGLPYKFYDPADCPDEPDWAGE